MTALNIIGKRPHSPSWHRRLRRARSNARYRCQQGRGRQVDFTLLRQHHGSMPPQKQAKSQGKGGKAGSDAQKTVIEFGLPAAAMTSLQAITSRATQELRHAPAGGVIDGSAEQNAQRRANVMRTLSKRIAGDVRAKTELSEALAGWMVQISQHLQGLVSRIRAISAKIDEDLQGACVEMRASHEAQMSRTTADQINQAMQALGAVWQPPQEEAIMRIAAGLRLYRPGRTQPPWWTRKGFIWLFQATTSRSSALVEAATNRALQPADTFERVQRRQTEKHPPDPHAGNAEAARAQVVLPKVPGARNISTCLGRPSARAARPRIVPGSRPPSSNRTRQHR